MDGAPSSAEPASARGLADRGRRRVRPVGAGAVIGALWGAISYAVLWGETSIVITRRYVDSVLGLVTLLPVRAVLWAIHVTEVRVAGDPFDFSRNHAWIGLVSAVVGAAVVGGAVLLVTGAAGRLRRPRS